MKYFFQHLIPWRIFLITLVYLLCILTIYFLIKHPWLIPNQVLRESVIISSSTGLIGSAFFFFLLWILKPHFIISDNIAYTDRYVNKNGYFIKIINNSLFFDCLDLTVKVFSYDEYVHSKNKELYNYCRRNLGMINEHLNVIPSRSKGGIFSSYRTAKYAQVFGTEFDLHSVFNDKKAVIFEIYAKHSLSGFSKIYEKKYNLSDCIENGMFGHGDNFSIS